MADPTNRLITVRPNMATTLASPMTSGDTSATFNNLGAYTVGNRVLLTIDAHNSSGTETPSAREVVYGEVSAGNTLINMVRAVEGTAQAHSAGAEVIDEVTAAHFRLLHDGLDSEHTATGAHDTALVAMLAGAQTFTGVKTFSAIPLLPANTVETADIQNAAITPEKMGLVKSAADANGWIKRNYGNWQTYERTQTISAVVIPAQSNASIVTLSLPVGITDSSELRFSIGVLSGFGGRVFASIDNGNTTAAVTSITVHLGNITTSSLTISGYIYIYAISA